MLSRKENLYEVMHGGNPDRFVNQYECLGFVFTPDGMYDPMPMPGQELVVNGWGVTKSWPADAPGAFPVFTEDRVVVKDIENWRDYVHTPKIKLSDAEWEQTIAAAEQLPDDVYRTVFRAPGLFENTHYLCEMTNTLIYLYENPDELKDLIKYLCEFEMELAEETCKHVHPTALFHHDDWGTGTSTFMAPDMFEEFYKEPTKQLYDCYRENGVELIVHHADCFAATLVPDMIDMGIDIWQGCVQANDLPDLIEKYGGQITFMGGLDGSLTDVPGWTRENIHEQVQKMCSECGKLYYIPCTTMGLSMCIQPGVYEAISEEIDEASKEMF